MIDIMDYTKHDENGTRKVEHVIENLKYNLIKLYIHFQQSKGKSCIQFIKMACHFIFSLHQSC